jgi:DNA-binding transcriptional MerR regulator
MTEPTYTTAQVHYRLRVPKPTIRNWSAEYAEFLSERARPDDGKTRLFTYDDMIILNTVRYLTRVEGLNSNEQIRQMLAAGRKLTELPRMKSSEEEEALEAVQLVPLAEVERALDRVTTLRSETARLTCEVALYGSERDLALLALDDANQQIGMLREANGRLRGLLSGAIIAGSGFVILLFALITAAVVYAAQ